MFCRYARRSPFLIRKLCRLFFFGMCNVIFYADDFQINSKPFIKDIRLYKENIDNKLDKEEMVSFVLPHDGMALEHLFEDCPVVTIHAYNGSIMKSYVRKHGLKFEALEE